MNFDIKKTAFYRFAERKKLRKHHSLRILLKKNKKNKKHKNKTRAAEKVMGAVSAELVQTAVQKILPLVNLHAILKPTLETFEFDKGGLKCTGFDLKQFNFVIESCQLGPSKKGGEGFNLDFKLKDFSIELALTKQITMMGTSNSVLSIQIANLAFNMDLEKGKS